MEMGKKLVLPGFEPGTFALSARRTTNCAIAPVHIQLFSFFYLIKQGKQKQKRKKKKKKMNSSSTMSLDFDEVLDHSEDSKLEAPLTTGVESSMNIVELVLKQCYKKHESKYTHS